MVDGQSYDDKGNLIVYDYKREDSDGIDVARQHERNRTGDPDAINSRAANRYLKRIRYFPYFLNQHGNDRFLVRFADITNITFGRAPDHRLRAMPDSCRVGIAIWLNSPKVAKCTADGSSRTRTAISQLAT